MRPQRQLLNCARLFFGDFRRTNVTCPATAASSRTEKGILLREVVEAFLRDNLDDGQRLVAKNADRQLASGHELLDEESLVVTRGFRESVFQFRFFLHDIDADRGSL